MHSQIRNRNERSIRRGSPWLLPDVVAVLWPSLQLVTLRVVLVVVLSQLGTSFSWFMMEPKGRSRRAGNYCAGKWRVSLVFRMPIAATVSREKSRRGRMEWGELEEERGMTKVQTNGV